jgi:hypothetical protein
MLKEPALEKPFDLFFADVCVRPPKRYALQANAHAHHLKRLSRLLGGRSESGAFYVIETE